MGILDDKVALVTGASRGIGRGAAIALASEGARVAITSRTMRPGDAPVLDGDGRRVPGSLAETLEALGATATDGLALPADLANVESVSGLVTKTVEKLGRIDILADCAMAFDLKDHGVAALALWPRWVLTERVKLAAEKKHPGFHVEESELVDADTPELIGRAIARLAVDPKLMEKSGHVQLIAELADEYDLVDADGRKPRIDEFTRELRDKVDCIEDALGW
jgi:NAD(P)-dependent dehydrogenase (short-subunit alcohol dehydrogenase family)